MVVSLNKSNEAATFRPIPAVEDGGTSRPGLEDEDEEEDGDSEFRDRGRAGFEGDIVSNISGGDVRELGRVNALSDALRTALLRKG